LKLKLKHFIPINHTKLVAAIMHQNFVRQCSSIINSLLGQHKKKKPQNPENLQVLQKLRISLLSKFIALTGNSI